MSAVRMVQMAIHQVINMVAMRHGFVAAIGTVSVGLLIGGAALVWRTFLRIRRSHLNLMVIHVITVSVNASGHREDNQCGRRVSRRCARSLGHARGCEPLSVVGECQSFFSPSLVVARPHVAEPALGVCGFHLAFTDSLNFT